MTFKKNWRYLLFSFLLMIAISSILFVSGVSVPVLPNNNSIVLGKNISLAKLYNEDLMEFDRQYKEDYLKQRNNFSNLEFKKIADKEDFVLKVGAKRDNIVGVLISNNNFVIDLIDCDSYERYCAFRINGVPTKKLFSFDEFGDNKKNSFDLDENFTMKINSAKFNFCDNRRFCHLGYEGYSLVDISIERKNGR